MMDDIVMVESPTTTDETSSSASVDKDAWELVDDDDETATPPNAMISEPVVHVGQAQVEEDHDEIDADQHDQHDDGALDVDSKKHDPVVVSHPQLLSDDEDYDATARSATDGDDDIASHVDETDVDDKPSCADDLKAAYDEVCARNLRALRKTKEVNAEMNAKARAALEEWTPKARQAYAEATEAAADCYDVFLGKAEQAADKIKQLIDDQANGDEDAQDHLPLTVLTPAVVIAALLVALLSWLASSSGVQELRPHDLVHMEQLTLIEKEMARLGATNYRPPTIEMPPYARPKNTARAKKNRTRAHRAASTAGVPARSIAQLTIPVPTFVNSTLNGAPKQPLERAQARRALNASWSDTITMAPAAKDQMIASDMQTKGWAAMDKRIGEATAQAAPLIVAGVYNSIGGWPSMDHHLSTRSNPIRREFIADTILARWPMEPTAVKLKKHRKSRSNRSIELPVVRSTAIALSSTPTPTDMGCYSYITGKNSQLILKSDSRLQLSGGSSNLTVLALGDGTLWPTIPLPPSPTIRAPISMPPIAMPMPPVGAPISMPPVALAMGSSAASDDAAATDCTAVALLRTGSSSSNDSTYSGCYSGGSRYHYSHGQSRTSNRSALMILPTEATYVLEELGMSSRESPSRRDDKYILPSHSTAVQINNHVQLPTDPAAGGFGAAGRLTIGAGWLSQWEWVSPVPLNKPFRPHHDFT